MSCSARRSAPVCPRCWKSACSPTPATGVTTTRGAPGLNVWRVATATATGCATTGPTRRSASRRSACWRTSSESRSRCHCSASTCRASTRGCARVRSQAPRGRLLWTEYGTSCGTTTTPADRQGSTTGYEVRTVMKRILLATLIATAVLSGSARASSAAGWWHLPKHPTWYWQLNGKIRFGLHVQIYDVDAFTTTAAEVSRLHSEHVHVICYVDVGTAENWRPDYSAFPQSVLGSPNGWPGEVWLDIRQLTIVEPIMAARFRLCHEKGFDAIEPDNMEAALNESGFTITFQQQLVYNKWVAEEIHSMKMAVLQKNDSEQTQQEN